MAGLSVEVLPPEVLQVEPVEDSTLSVEVIQETGPEVEIILGTEDSSVIEVEIIEQPVEVIEVLTGVQGPRGRPGAGITFAYDPGVEYATNDIVRHNNILYYATAPSLAEEPPAGAWAPLVEHIEDRTYLHYQNIPANIWTINHNLGKLPSITVMDTAGTVWYGEITYPSLNTATVTFSFNLTGRASCN